MEEDAKLIESALSRMKERQKESSDGRFAKICTVCSDLSARAAAGVHNFLENGTVRDVWGDPMVPERD